MTLLEVLESLDPNTDICCDAGDTVTASELLDRLDGHSDLAEPAAREGNEIYLATESGDIYTAGDPVYTIVE